MVDINKLVLIVLDDAPNSDDPTAILDWDILYVNLPTEGDRFGAAHRVAERRWGTTNDRSRRAFCFRQDGTVPCEGRDYSPSEWLEGHYK
jgi:hypothetical protein